MTVYSYCPLIDKSSEISYNSSVVSVLLSMTRSMPLWGGAPQMARDEARHGQAFKGLLDRYFGK